MPEQRLEACRLLRSCLANLLDPPELLQKAQAMMRLKASVGQIYAVLCLQTKAKAFIAQSKLAALSVRRRPRPQTANSRRPISASRSVQQALPRPSSSEVRRRSYEAHQVLVASRRMGEDATGVTARRRWSLNARPENVPPLALEFVQFGERLGRDMAAMQEAGQKEMLQLASDEAACGSAVSAVRAAMEKGSKPKRPMSSPALMQPRAVVSVRRQIRSAGSQPKRGPPGKRPASGLSRSRKAGGWERSDAINSQAELWLIKQRSLAGMLWPPMSEAARGRRPKSGQIHPPHDQEAAPQLALSDAVLADAMVEAEARMVDDQLLGLGVGP